MSSKLLIAVTGITGRQGGAVARALLQDGTYDVLGVTRDPQSERAKTLADQLKIKMVKADMADEGSLRAAFQGCYGAFLVTDYWASCGMDPLVELQHIKNLGNACKAAGVEHVVFSALEDTRKIVKEDNPLPKLKGLYVPHYDMKGEGLEWMRAQGIPATGIYTSFFYSNFIDFGMGPKRYVPDQPAVITFPLGTEPFPMNDVEDIGRFAAAVFKDKSTMGKTLGVSSQTMTMEEVAKLFTETLGIEVRYNMVSRDEYAKLPFPGADDRANMFQFNSDYNKEFCSLRSSEDVKKYLPRGVPLRDWIMEHKEVLLQRV
ncbi:hypothetical protein GUITHDRAFT_114763 [Guillardia theta CCMP2712]|uniref:NmrA-like domain-containing protein n=1 Tax=Guillardia theta (strain CCMP2712) TaxID=905079 RepID=L1ISL9_GUITC|nr:hypothetical protein GUITHDRAFT_114763 [Guillardia theta CCMP2712]EKX39102.1 hypothetical protein GUITHDRAFT_114763 [Guillardia theta CCMP2712]|eukprot:XP_005826082.1 hypothetical protein GUITHDRAFT_114763 [Guillardia theta CCMP2712]